MSQFITWGGLVTRVNAFGVFPPNQVVEVPDHVAVELLKVVNFKLSSGENIVPEDATVEDLRASLVIARQERDAAIQANTELAAAYAVAQEKVAEYEEAVGDLDLNPVGEDEEVEVKEDEEVENEDTTNTGD